MSTKAIVGMAVIVALAVIAIYYLHQNRGVHISRQGNGHANVEGQLSSPCGDAPSNIKSAYSSALEAAVNNAIKNAHGRDLDAHVKAELASTLEKIPASSETANDLAVLQVTACRSCLAEGLSADECVQLGKGVRQDYLDLKKRTRGNRAYGSPARATRV